jgi:sec-independent protein translocase protein TatC
VDEVEQKSDARMTFGEHLEDLRRRLIYALVGMAVSLAVCLIFGRQILTMLVYPYNRVMGQSGGDASLSILSVSGGLMLYFRVCLYSALVLGAPWVLYHLWMFVSVGLYEREKRYVKRSMPFSAVLFVGGALFFVFVVSLPILGFFHAFNAWIGVKEIITLDNHIHFMTNMMLVFGLGFQTPLVVFVLVKVGLVSLGTLNHYRRHVVVGILIFAALFTSPSPLDMILLAIPMWLLYELGVLLAYFSVGRKRQQSSG